jgi:UTP--glucose-1-phosphate uridylyltransferase
LKINKAVILAAGKGTRFLPYTKAYPKEMLAVVDKPALQLIVEEVAAAGITDILIVISPEKTAITKHFAPDEALANALYAAGKTVEADSIKELNNLADVSFVYQERVTGSSMAVYLAKDWAENQPFAVLNGDDVIFNAEKPVTAQLADAFDTAGKSIIGVQTVTREAIKKYATCKVVQSNGRLHLISDIVEKPQTDAEIYSLLAPLGRYIVTPDIFDVIEHTPVRSGGEVYITDSLQIQAKNGGIYAYDFEGLRYDFGDKLGYLKGVTEFALRDPKLGAAYRQYLLDLTKHI